MVAQFGLVGQWPLSSFVLWVVIAAAGAATVLSFAILGEYYPKQMSGRANAALNLLHVGGAFVLQSANGSIIAIWPQTHGAYPAEAHQAAMGTMLLLQLAALVWFALPRRRAAFVSVRGSRGSVRTSGWQTQATARYAIVGSRTQHVHRLHRQRAQWRLAAAASTAVCVGLIAAVFTLASRPVVAIRAPEVVPIGVEAIDGLEASLQSQQLRVMPSTFMRPIGVAIPLRTTVEMPR
jgi:hypothetical protein